MHRSTAFVRRACAVGTATALVGLTTGFGVMTATTAYADAGPVADTTVSASATPGSAATAPAAPTLPTDAGTPTTGAAPAAPAESTPAAVTPTPSAAPATTAPTADAQPEAPVKVAAVTAVAVVLAGDAKVGSTLAARTSGFTKPTSFSYLWTVGGVDTTVDDGSYVIEPDDVEKTITVIVTNTLRDGTTETAEATSAVVTQDPVFVDANGEPITSGTDPDDDALALETTAGADYTYTFRATGSPKPTFALAWSYPEDVDGEGTEATPADQLPDGFVFDAATGTLTGSTDQASYYSFAVTATSGTASVTEYVDLDVEAAAPFGVQVFAADKARLEAFAGDGDDVPEGTLTSWLIDSDGTVFTETTTIHETSDGIEWTDDTVEGGTPTAPQGGTLLVNGNVVDRFGNEVSDTNGDAIPTTVTSNVASDVITADDDQFFFGNIVDVTFPHASTHRLTVTADDFSTAFDVSVVPTATTPPAAVPPVVAPVAQPIGTVPASVATATKVHRLAYTGTDATGVLPWALGMLAAGAALVGLRTARRRTARR